jgi:ribosomal protein S7
MEKLRSDKRFTFGTETDPDDPRNQNEDLGDNAMLASGYGIKNLQRIVPQILDWTKEPNKDYAMATSIYGEVVTQYGRYMGHVAKNIAGIYRTPLVVEQSGNSEEFVPASIQKEAMQFLDQQLFSTPEWLIDKTLITKASVDPVNSIGSVQKRTLDRLISKYTIDKMLRDEAYNGAGAYTAINMFSDLKKSVWSELTNGKAIDIYRRNLQKNYVNALISIVDPKNATPQAQTRASDATGIARTQLIDLRQSIRNAAASSSGIKRSHLQDLLAQIETALDTGK